MPTLHLMVGLPCSGKTTYAKQLEDEYHALRLTTDTWHLQLFGQDLDGDSHDKNHAVIEKIMWDVAQRVLLLGTNVILDFGCWGRAERDAFREKARAMGVDFQMHYREVSEKELFARLHIRNETESDSAFVIPADKMKEYVKMFQPPTAEELGQSANGS